MRCILLAVNNKKNIILLYCPDARTQTVSGPARRIALSPPSPLITSLFRARGRSRLHNDRSLAALLFVHCGPGEESVVFWTRGFRRVCFFTTSRIINCTNNNIYCVPNEFHWPSQKTSCVYTYFFFSPDSHLTRTTCLMSSRPRAYTRCANIFARKKKKKKFCRFETRANTIVTYFKRADFSEQKQQLLLSLLLDVNRKTDYYVPTEQVHAFIIAL